MVKDRRVEGIAARVSLTICVRIILSEENGGWIGCESCVGSYRGISLGR